MSTVQTMRPQRAGTKQHGGHPSLRQVSALDCAVPYLPKSGPCIFSARYPLRNSLLISDTAQTIHPNIFDLQKQSGRLSWHMDDGMRILGCGL